MLNYFSINEVKGYAKLHGLIVILQQIVKGSKNSNLEEDTNVSVNYKQQYIAAQKQLDLLEKELSGLSKSLKSDSTVYWNYSDDYIAGMQKYSIKVDRIINKHFSPAVVTDRFGTGAWRNPIFRPALDKSI